MHIFLNLSYLFFYFFLIFTFYKCCAIVPFPVLPDFKSFHAVVSVLKVFKFWVDLSLIFPNNVGFYLSMKLFSGFPDCNWNHTIQMWNAPLIFAVNLFLEQKSWVVNINTNYSAFVMHFLYAYILCSCVYIQAIL